MNKCFECSMEDEPGCLHELVDGSVRWFCGDCWEIYMGTPRENKMKYKTNGHDFDCTMVCINAKKCFQACVDGNIDIERDDEECKKMGGLIQSSVA